MKKELPAAFDGVIEDLAVKIFTLSIFIRDTTDDLNAEFSELTSPYLGLQLKMEAAAPLLSAIHLELTKIMAASGLSFGPADADTIAEVTN